jgi:hypothetical protein
MADSPDPLTDLRKGLGLLLRAARTAAKNLPTKDLEGVVATSAREVGRAFENVAAAVEREIRGKPDSPKPPSAPAPTPPDGPEGEASRKDDRPPER